MPNQSLLPAAPEPCVSFRDAFVFWLKLGFVSFGGPAGQIAIMHQELVEKRRWISERRFLHALNFCMVLPGPEAQQLATYIGWLMHRTWGGIVAGVLFVLPSLFILIALSWVYMALGEQPAVAAVLYGIKPAVTAIVVFAAYRIGSRALRNPALWGIAAAAFVATLALNVPFPAIVIAAGMLGYAGGRWRPEWFSTASPHGSAAGGGPPAAIDDGTPTPAHARFSKSRAVRTGFIGLAIWGAAMITLRSLYGWEGLLPAIGWFFTKAALLTFGGAYAVLPYVFQGAVEKYQWLSATQMIDGLALGETTPGPLIMVVAFVGFIAGYKQAVLAGEWPLFAGAVAASVATFFTFLPSFLFILVGGPIVETTHGELRFTAPLTGITAAVVGVILNLAVFFAYHVLWPAAGPANPFGGVFQWPAALIGTAAFVALIRFRIGVIPVIGACALAGLAVRLLPT
jgi:chromate transporter